MEPALQLEYDLTPGPSSPLVSPGHCEEGIDLDLEIDMDAYNRAPQYNRKRLDKYLPILRFVNGLSGAQLQAKIVEWNALNPQKAVSRSSIYDAIAMVREGGLSALLGQYGKRAGITNISDIDFQVFKSLYMKMGKPSLYSCWLMTLGAAMKRSSDLCQEDFPRPQAFMRRLQHDVTPGAICLAREGQAIYNRKFGTYIDRDYSNMRAGEIWVSDHRRCDVMVKLPDGKITAPWVTAWIDMKTGKWLSWILRPQAPSSDTIFQTFKWALEKYGLPAGIYIDNGKDYLCRDFAGGRRKKYDLPQMSEDPRMPTIQMLGIRVHRAIVRQAQSKVIERAFLNNKFWLDMNMPGYCGGHPKERPEILKDEIKRGSLLSFEEFVEVFDYFIQGVVNKKISHDSKRLQGRSPDQAFAEEYTLLKKVSPEAIRMFCMRSTKDIMIHKNGITDSSTEITYHNDNMIGMHGRLAFLRIDSHDVSTADVYASDTGEFLFTAQSNVHQSPAIARTPIEKAVFTRATAAKKRAESIALAYARTQEPLDAYEKVVAMAAGVQAEREAAGEKDMPLDPRVIEIPNTIMDKVAKQKIEQEKIGTADISDLVPDEQQSGMPRIFADETDRELWERRQKTGT